MVPISYSILLKLKDFKMDWKKIFKLFDSIADLAKELIPGKTDDMIIEVIKGILDKVVPHDDPNLLSSKQNSPAVK